MEWVGIFCRSAQPVHSQHPGYYFKSTGGAINILLSQQIYTHCLEPQPRAHQFPLSVLVAILGKSFLSPCPPCSRRHSWRADVHKAERLPFTLRVPWPWSLRADHIKIPSNLSTRALDIALDICHIPRVLSTFSRPH